MKVVVVTGASQGLGQEIARVFAGYGWRVVGTGRSPRPEALPENIQYEQFDASDAVVCEAFWRKITGQYPAAEVCLVNNAGGYVSGGLTETTPEQYASQMQSIYFTAVYMTRGLAIVRDTAKIFNVISASALAAHKHNSAYGAAKAAEAHFFQALQQEFKPTQYQITNLYPSDIASHGPAPSAINPSELAMFICSQANAQTSYYMRDATLYPTV